MDVLVIGAGPAGISSAHYLEQAGIAYRVIDKASIVGSTWASLYPSLRLNTAHFVSHLPGKLMPLSYGVYPYGHQYYAYLKRYVEERTFNITLGVTVSRVAPENGGWRVESSEETAWYPAVILATGRFDNPYLPHVEGQETFIGRLLHTHDYHAADNFREQRVMIVGCGPSGGDIAAELSRETRQPVLLSIRSDLLIARRYPYGLPDTLWCLLFGGLPESVREPILNTLTYQSYPELRRFNVKLAPDREHRRGSSAPVRGRELVDALLEGRVIPVAGLKRLVDRCAELDDGTAHEVDVVMLATGYRPVLNYLDIDFTPGADGWPPRDPGTDGHGQGIAGSPGLYLVGRYYRGLGPLHNIKGEARNAVRQIAAQLKM